MDMQADVSAINRSLRSSHAHGGHHAPVAHKSDAATHKDNGNDDADKGQKAVSDAPQDDDKDEDHKEADADGDGGPTDLETLKKQKEELEAKIEAMRKQNKNKGKEKLAKAYEHLQKEKKHIGGQMDTLKKKLDRYRDRIDEIHNEEVHLQQELHLPVDLEAPALEWKGIALLVLILGCICSCVCACSGWLVYAECQEDFEGYEKLEIIGYAESASRSKEQILKLVRRETRLMILSCVIPLLASPYTSCHAGTPTWAYLCYLPLLFRNKVIEVQILRELDSPIYIYPFLVFSVFEHLDHFTDCAFPIQAYMCDAQGAQLTAKFAASFLETPIPAMAEVVSTLRFWGLTSILFVAATMAQQAMASITLTPKVPAKIAIAADSAAMAAVSLMTDEAEDGGQGVKPAKILIPCSKVLVENCMQMWLQSSYLGITFDSLSGQAKVKMLISLGLGLMAACTKCMGSILDQVYLVYKDKDTWWFLCTWCVPSYLGLLMCAWTCAKLYFTFHCASHMWNVTSGCVHFTG
jgi:hypothetical protein